MLLMLDNYDSFTYNLVQYLMVLEQDVRVLRNDEIDTAACLALEPSVIVVSPGPGTPQDAGISMDLIARASGRIPILGVCLGHQSIGAAFGARIVPAARLMHGKVSEIHHDGRDVFAGIRSPLKATRYHSLAVERASLPACLEVTATDEGDEIMAMRHRDHVTFGVQFHPESILTPAGKRLLANFLKLARTGAAAT